MNRPAALADDPFGNDTPAIYTSRQINTVLGTDKYLDSLIDHAELTTAVQLNQITKPRGSRIDFCSAQRRRSRHDQRNERQWRRRSKPGE